MTDKNSIIDETVKILMKTYAPQPVVMERGEGVYAWDTDGKRYLDFAVGIAVASLGHAHPAMLKTIQEQAALLMACQASYATKPKLEAAQILIDNSCFDRVYFSNSGTESVEAALKCARKWAYENKSENANEIISFRNSFHGRTYGSASVTEKCLSQPFFAPYLDGVHFANFNDLESVEALVSDRTAAIIVEPVQGEGGLVPADPCFLYGLRQICDTHNIALIFDEIQAGMGRLGTFFAYESFACCGGVSGCENGSLSGSEQSSVVLPDIACLAKGMGGGFPVGAMVARGEFALAITTGTHGTTYGGNPLACAVAATVMRELLKDGFLEKSRKVGAHFMQGLQALKRDSSKITDIRGMGMMIGVDTIVPIGDLLRQLQKNGLMATQAGKATLRLTPPLLIDIEHADEAIEIIAKSLQEL